VTAAVLRTWTHPKWGTRVGIVNYVWHSDTFYISCWRTSGPRRKMSFSLKGADSPEWKQWRISPKEATNG